MRPRSNCCSRIAQPTPQRPLPPWRTMPIAASRFWRDCVPPRPLAEQGTPQWEEFEALASQLTARPRESVEIERKYLLRGLPEAALGVEPIEIEQGWLPGRKVRERLRPYLERFDVPCDA